MPVYYAALNIVSACWILFLIVWIVAAQGTKRAVYRESKMERLRYSALLVIGYVLLVNGGRLPYPLNLRLIPKIEPAECAGIILCIAGLAFSFWARYTIGRNWSGTITFKENHELIERGPYRLTRHPIYTGLITMFVGTELVLGRVAGMIALAFVFLSFWIKLKEEEKLMLQQFPDQYAAYQKRVKRLVPFLL